MNNSREGGTWNTDVSIPDMSWTETSIPRDTLQESTLTTKHPLNAFDALMRCAPGEAPAPTLAEIQGVRESVVDCLDLLSADDRFVLEAIHAERLSIGQLAKRLGFPKTTTHSLVKRAEAALREHLLAHPKIKEHFAMLNPPTTWNEAARRIIATIASDMSTDDALKIIQRKIESLRPAVRKGTAADEIICPQIRTIGQCAAAILVNQGNWHTDEMLALLCRKQRSYGHGNVLAFRGVGLAVRLSDKVARYENMTANDVDDDSEPLLDSLLDMVGYAVIAQMLLDGTFELELA